MAYEKHTWVTRERITKENLNNMEDGIAANDTKVSEHDGTLSEHEEALDILTEWEVTEEDIDNLFGSIYQDSVTPDDEEMVDFGFASQASVGNLSDLNMPEAGNLVNAINYVDDKVGPLSSLDTTEKTKAVLAINEVLDVANDAKGAADSASASVTTSINNLIANQIGTITDKTTKTGDQLTYRINQLSSDLADQGKIVKLAEILTPNDTTAVTVELPTDWMTTYSKLHIIIAHHWGNRSIVDIYKCDSWAVIVPIASNGTVDSIMRIDFANNGMQLKFTASKSGLRHENDDKTAIYGIV